MQQYNKPPHRTGSDKKMQNRRKSSRRRTSVRRGAKADAEKAKTFNFKQESVRIPTLYMP